MSKYSGIKLVEYEASPASWGGSEVSLGKPLADSEGVGFDPQTVENSAGNLLYAGNKDAHAFNIPDLSKFAALETIMKADTEVDVRITFMDDTTEVILTYALATVKKLYGSAVGSRNSFEVRFTGYST